MGQIDLAKLVKDVEKNVETKLPAVTNPLIDCNAHGTISQVCDVLQFLSVAEADAVDGACDGVKHGVYWIHVWLQATLRYAEAQSQLQSETERATFAALQGGARP
jgi:hypothetical protein